MHLLHVNKIKSIIRNWLCSDLVRQYLRGSFWMLFARALWVLSSLLVGIVVVRKLGPSTFGYLNYVVAYVGIFSVIVNLGLDVIVERSLVHHPENEGRILGNYFVFKLCSLAIMLVALGISFLFVENTRLIPCCVIVAMGYLLYPFNVVQCLFIARVKNHFNAWAQIACCIVYNSIRLFAVLNSATMEVYFAAEAVLIGFSFAMMFIFYWMFCNSPIKWSFSWNEVFMLLPSALPLSITVVLGLVYARTDMLMLKHFLGEEAVGLYTIASRFTENWTLCIQIFAQVFSAAVISAYNISKAEYSKQLHRYYFMLFWITMPPIFLMMAFGRTIIVFLYGHAFEISASILYWHILSLPCNGLLWAFHSHAVNEQRLSVIAAVFCSGALLNVIMNMFLIPALGAQGAAICSAAAMPIGMVLTLLCTRKGRSDLRFMLGSLFSLPSFRLGKVANETLE